MAYDYAYYKKSADYVLGKIKEPPEVALVLGSALGGLAEAIEDKIIIPYEDIPNFLVSTVASHAGKLIVGKLAGKTVVCMSGRFHYYEGYDYEQLAAPIRLFKLLGVKSTLITNAAGAVNKSYVPGDVVIVKDHINLAGASPMRGGNVAEFGPRFFDIGDMYTAQLRTLAKELAQKSSLTIHEGTYMFFVGPHFESPAEIVAARTLGADAVGMSTVTEALTAAHCGMPLLCLSLMTNMAAGVLEQPLDSDEVDVNAQRVAQPFCEYVMDIVAHM